jgi:hypothetical protein
MAPAFLFIYAPGFAVAVTSQSGTAGALPRFVVFTIPTTPAGATCARRPRPGRKIPATWNGRCRNRRLAVSLYVPYVRHSADACWPDGLKRLFGLDFASSRIENRCFYYY